MASQPLILVTNDDGVHAPGIKHLWKCLTSLGDIRVVAPSSEQSAVSLGITVRRPLQIEKIEWAAFSEAQVWSVNGTPADSVKLALNVILPRQPDIILSGINRGSNAGRNVLYSGTVAAVIEGVMQNIPGIAFSMADDQHPDYSEAEKYIPSLVEFIVNHPLPSGTLLNVNFPKQIKDQMKGMRFAQQGKEYWRENPEKRQHPAEGNSYYWLGAKVAKFSEEDDCDVMLLRQGYGTMVPIQVADLTHHHHLKQLKENFKKLDQISLI